VALAADGWIVVVSGRRKDALEQVVANIGKKRRQGRGHRARRQQQGKRQQGRRSDRRQTCPDRSSGQQRRQSTCRSEAGPTWSCQAGTKLVEINLNGVLYCMHAVLPTMRKQKDGCIINVASWAGRHVSKMPGPGLHHDQACGCRR